MGLFDKIHKFYILCRNLHLFHKIRIFFRGFLAIFEFFEWLFDETCAFPTIFVIPQYFHEMRVFFSAAFRPKSRFLSAPFDEICAFSALLWRNFRFFLNPLSKFTLFLRYFSRDPLTKFAFYWDPLKKFGICFVNLLTKFAFFPALPCWNSGFSVALWQISRFL